MELYPIRNDDDHARALRDIAALWDAPDDSLEADYMDALATLVHAYEQKRWPIERSTPVEIIRFMMEQNDYTQKDLGEVLGSASRASEILSGKRSLSIEQIRLLHAKWHIPVAALIGELEQA